MKKIKFYGPFSCMEFICLKAVEPLWGDSLLFTPKSPWDPDTHVIELWKMKGWVNLGATQQYWIRDCLDWESGTLTSTPLQQD